MDQIKLSARAPGTSSGAAPGHCIFAVGNHAAGICAAHAAPGTAQACRSFACAILDAFPDQMAVLSGQGAIVAVNAAWRVAACAHAGVAPTASAGHDYFAAYHAAHGPAPEQARTAREGIAAVLAGQAPDYTLEYACPSPAGQRWFSMAVTPLRYGWDGVVVAHSDITARRMAEADLRIAAIAFESPEGMIVTAGAVACTPWLSSFVWVAAAWKRKCPMVSLVVVYSA